MADRAPHIRAVPAVQDPAPLLNLAAGKERSAYTRFAKPVIDRVGGLVLALVTLPLFVIVALAVWIEVGSPVILRQQRVGLGGRTIRVLKFRSMLPDRRDEEGPSYIGRDRRVNHKSDLDPRLTRVGRFIRKWSLDELPQLWNVVRGDMSLVGPRPELTFIVGQYAPWQHRRHAVKPGITGLWQVSARGDRPMHEATDVDLAYVDRISLWTDLKILARTLPAALGSRRGF